MNIPYDRFLCWRCPKCGQAQGHTNNKYQRFMTIADRYQAIQKLSMMCKRCGKRTKFHKKQGVAVKHCWMDDTEQLRLTVSSWNLEKGGKSL